MDRLAYFALCLLMEVAVKSTILAVFAGGILWAFRVRDASLRHHVCFGLVVGMLVLPLLRFVTPVVLLPPSWQIASSSQVAPVRKGDVIQRERMAKPFSDGKQQALPFSDDRSDRSNESLHDTSRDGASASGAWFFGIETSPLRTLGIQMAMLAYLTVVLVFVLRLALGLYLTRRMIKRAQPIAADRAQNLLATHKGCQLLESSEIAVPAVVGFWRPRIVLPMAWQQWEAEKIRSVIIHESTHVLRGDWLLMFICEVNCAIYFFHPLAWYLQRRISELAECCCDDAVLRVLGSRALYARFLLEIAVDLRKTGRRFQPLSYFAAMARRSGVERRIDAILDEQRTLTRNVGVIARVSLVTATLVVVAGLAAVRPSSTIAEDGKTADADRVVGEGEDRGESQEHDSTETNFVYEGRVIAPNGQPVVGAKLFLAYWYSDQTERVPDQPNATTDADGRFRFEMRRSDFRRTGDSVRPWQWASLAAFHDGAGAAWAPSIAFETSGHVLRELENPENPMSALRQRTQKQIAQQNGELQLVRNDFPITAKFMDAAGRSVAGVRVSLLGLQTGEGNSLDAWDAAMKRPSARPEESLRLLSSHLVGPMTMAMMAPVVSNEQGEVRIEGLGNDRLVKLLLQRDDIKMDVIYCRTRAGDPIELPYDYDGSRVIYGPSFTHIVAPSRPAAGIVRDRVTNEPIAGVVVSSSAETYSDAPGEFVRAGSNYAQAITGNDGRYLLNGLPTVDRNLLVFQPPRDANYLSASSRVDTSVNDMSPLQNDVSLVRGVVVRGRTVDEQTGEGVSGELNYLIDRENGLLAERKVNGWSVPSVRSDTEGRFRIVVPAGKGFLTFVSFDPRYEQRQERPPQAESVGGEEILGVFAASTGPPFHATAKLDFENVKQTVPQEMEIRVKKGRMVTGTVLDDQGQPLAGCQFYGREPSGSWLPDPLETSDFTVWAYRPERPRRVLFIHRERKLSGAAVILGDLPQPFTVQLAPWSTVTGRLLNDDGSPAPNVRIMSVGIRQGAMQRPGIPGPSAIQLPPNDREPDQGFITDENGRFVIEGLVAVQEYRLIGLEGIISPEGRRREIERIVKLEPGERRDLGDMTLSQP